MGISLRIGGKDQLFEYSSRSVAIDRRNVLARQVSERRTKQRPSAGFSLY